MDLILYVLLNLGISDSIISIGPSYIPYQKDRETLGGGVIAYVKTAIPSSRLSYSEEDYKEVLWLLLKPKRLPRPFSCIVMIVVYYPPGQTTANETSMIDYLTNGIDSVLQSYPSAGIIIAGDFNRMKLGALCNRFDLGKIVKKPTRGKNVLDQIVSNMLPLFQEVQHLPPLGRSDTNAFFWIQNVGWVHARDLGHSNQWIVLTQ